MAAFFTRNAANEGIEIPLSYPDTSPSPFWIRIRGKDSDAYQKAHSKFQQTLLQASYLKTPEERKNLNADEMTLDVLESLVIGWNLPEEFNSENVRKLLREAPQIADQIERLAKDRAYFFKKRPENSMPSQTQK